MLPFRAQFLPLRLGQPDSIVGDCLHVGERHSQPVDSLTLRTPRKRHRAITTLSCKALNDFISPALLHLFPSLGSASVLETTFHVISIPKTSIATPNFQCHVNTLGTKMINLLLCCRRPSQRCLCHSSASLGSHSGEQIFVSWLEAQQQGCGWVIECTVHETQCGNRRWEGLAIAPKSATSGPSSKISVFASPIISLTDCSGSLETARFPSDQCALFQDRR